MREGRFIQNCTTDIPDSKDIMDYYIGQESLNEVIPVS